MALTIPFDNSYARLPERFYARLPPTPVATPKLIRVNAALAEELGISAAGLASPEGVEVLAGNRVAAGSEPIAQAYAGHQFGGFTPQLGDGRAILLGEVVDQAGRRRDIQLKGSGPTPFSRRGDGRAALGPVLREFIVSEAMHAMGIPTTRSLAAVTTGEEVYRETALPGAVLTRVAASHIRVGTFQFFAVRGDEEALRILADHVIARHDPDLAGTDRPYHGLIAAVAKRQAELIARWLLIGFVHGVMNTDNMAVSGETIDYGPCAFMDAYDPGMVLSSIDHGGRYAYGNQPRIGQWNLARLAETLLPLLGAADEAAAVEQAQEALSGYVPAFQSAYTTGLLAKIGIASPRPGDEELVQTLLNRLAEQGADFTNSFRALSDAEAGDDAPLRAALGEAWDGWSADWRARLAQAPGDAATRRDAMRAVNPAVIPRNHLVEAAIAAAVERSDFGPFEALLDATSRPFDDAADPRFRAPPRPEERVRATFCGT
ncbi:MAG: YdiU family protein [Acetobacteraceae bacterium]|nr:YdiU family protein [Acetobacteraceae bacterium]